MKSWPVPESFSKKLPEKGAPGSFWENREDRHHCGVDIYAPKGSKVCAVEAGEVIDIGQFTSPELIPYWNVTYYILIQLQNGWVSKYAELGQVLVKPGQRVRAGQVIALVGIHSPSITHINGWSHACDQRSLWYRTRIP